MKYSIKEVSNLLNISPEMIRYYEKNGAVHPQRDKNNYRYYTTLDLFEIMEAMRLKGLHMNISEVEKTKNKDYTTKLLQHLSSLKQELDKEIKYNQILYKRAEEFIEFSELARDNLNNYWVKKVPGYYASKLVISKGDNYEEIITDKETLDNMFQDKVVPFLFSIVEFNEDKDIWYNCFNEDCGNFFNLDQFSFDHVEESLYLCTVINMGSIGNFSHKCLDELIEYAKNRGYQQNGPILGYLDGRGYDNGEYHRYMELRMPIRR